MTVYFTKYDYLILFYFNLQKFKVSFKVIRHHCFVMVATRNLHTCVCFYVNIRLNEKNSLVEKLEDQLTRRLVKAGNIMTIFDVLPNFPFTTSEAKLDY